MEKSGSLYCSLSLRYNTQRVPHLQTTSKLVSNNEFVILFVLYMLHKIRDSFIITSTSNLVMHNYLSGT